MSTKMIPSDGLNGKLFLEGKALLAWLANEPDVIGCVHAHVSSETAAKMLSKNTKNRPIGKSKLAVYAEDMKNDRFPTTSNAVSFDADSALQNGQHRLQACVQSDHGFWCFIAKGLNPKSFIYEDVHIKRSLSDVLCIMKEPHYSYLAGSLSLLHRYVLTVRLLNKKDAGDVNWERAIDKMMWNTARGSNHEKLDLLNDHPGLRESVRRYSSISMNVMVARSWLGAMHYIGSRASMDLTETFMEKFTSLSGLENDEPVSQLVHVLQNANSKRQMEPYLRMRYFIKALRLHLQGKKVSKLVVVRRTKDEATGIVTKGELPTTIEDLVPVGLRIG